MPSRPLKVQSFFITWPFCVIKSKATQTWYYFFLITFNIFPKLSWMLTSVTCLFKSLEFGGRGEKKPCVLQQNFMLLFLSCYLNCLNFSLTKISALCHFCRPWGLLIACGIEQRIPSREISTLVFESWAKTAQENSSLEPVAFSLLSVPKTLLPGVRKYSFLWRWLYAVPLLCFNKRFS